LLQGSNRIYALSWLRIGPKIVYLALVTVVYLTLRLDTKYALLCHLISIAIVVISIVFLSKPKITSRIIVYRSLIEENKVYGFPVYLGSITGVASSYLAGITIGYFIDNINVGFYSLAITASMPLAMLPSSLGITFFKDFVTWQKIPLKVILLTFLVGGAMLTLFLFFIGDIVHFLYTEEFSPVIQLTYFTAIGSFFHGIGDFFNKFISAKGKGKLVMNSNLILGTFNLIGFTLFIYFWNIWGAVITKLLAGLIYMGIMIYYYLSYQKKV
jgi:O-antigen/teichoic acid export membrane protein